MVVAGCSSSPVGPPVEVGLEGTDLDSAALIRELVVEAGKSPRDASRRAALGMAYEVSGLVRSARTCYEQAVALGSHIQKHLISMEDGREGPRAFVERRKPEFKNR